MKYMAVAGAGAEAEIMDKVGAGAEINNFGSATLMKLVNFHITFLLPLQLQS